MIKWSPDSTLKYSSTSCFQIFIFAGRLVRWELRMCHAVDTRGPVKISSKENMKTCLVKMEGHVWADRYFREMHYKTQFCHFAHLLST
jgi:hypothetical protein